MTVSPEDAVQLEKMQEHGLRPDEGVEFMAAGFLPALEVATSIVLCRQVPVSRVSSALQPLESCAELEEVGGAHTTCGGALFQFLLGKGQGKAFSCGLLLCWRNTRRSFCTSRWSMIWR